MEPLLLVVTPSHPEYISGHSTVSGSAATVLANFFGDKQPFANPLRKMPQVRRAFPKFRQQFWKFTTPAYFGGIHYRFLHRGQCRRRFGSTLRNDRTECAEIQ